MSLETGERMARLRLALYVMWLLSPAWALASGEKLFAWLSLGSGGQAIVRTVSKTLICPELIVDSQPVPLHVRARPLEPEFPILVCETILPNEVTQITIDGRQLPLPKRNPEKIVVLGDTGCRVAQKLIQNCRDPNAWPFAQIAQSAATWQPDLVIHVGDYFYRDAPCPDGNAACAGSPWGDTWAVAYTDFFSLAQPLLKAAPWIFVRGNHEACNRTGNAWFRLLDPRPLPETCTDETEPYVVPLGDHDIFVLDTTTAHDILPTTESVAYFADQFVALAEHGQRPAWLLSHKPIWAFGSLGRQNNIDQLFRTNPTLQAAVRQDFLQHIDVILSGHLHKIEFLAFAQGKPLQFVIGNGGAFLNPPLSTQLVGLEIADRTVSTAEILPGFGYVTLEQKGAGWVVTPYDAAGVPQPCQFTSEGIGCAPPD